MIPSDRVRQLWTEFELWHAAQHLAIEQRVDDALRELDLKWRIASPKNRISKTDLDERKTMARLEIEKTLSGNTVRLEWQRRLDRAGLQSDAWNNMTVTERRKVEAILGADMDPAELTMSKLKNYRSSRKGTLFSPVTSRRWGGKEDALKNYAIVDPHSFSAESTEENEFEPWIDMVKARRSDDEISLDASTSSSTGFGSADSSSWSSAVSSSSTQTSRTSSPDYIPSKNLPSDLAFENFTNPTTLIHDNQSLSPPFRMRYIGPDLLTDLSETLDEEAEFDRFKFEIRIRKIREFHEEAADADICLLKEITKMRRSHGFARGEEMKRIEKHESDMLELRRRKEHERKEIVEEKRQKKKAELRQHTVGIAKEQVRSHIVRKVADVAPETSETPTVRGRQRQRNALRTGLFLDGGTPLSMDRSSTSKIPDEALFVRELSPVLSSTPTTNHLPLPEANQVCASVCSLSGPIEALEVSKSKEKALQGEKATASSKTALEKTPKNPSGPDQAAKSSPTILREESKSPQPSGSVNLAPLRAERSSSSVFSVASAASVSAKPKSAEPPFNSPSSTAKTRVIEPGSPVVASSTKSRTTESTTSVASRSPSDLVRMTASTTSATAVLPSAWTAWAPLASHPQSSQVPEDRRVWVPPASTVVGKAKRLPVSRSITEPAPQTIEKTISCSQTEPKHITASGKHPNPVLVTELQMRAPSKSLANVVSGNQEIPGEECAGKQPERSRDSLGIVKMGVGAEELPKQTTIQEVDDDENAKTPEHLPTDSRYIMEPVQPKLSTSPPASTNDMEKDQTQWSSDSISSLKPNSDPFLLMLDSLEAIMQSSDSSKEEEKAD
ncbi:hypothetical protein VKT23_012674 [Stygiomarasmius scandens]|uniref:Uncharacterized protein n=1 Tax=Marasmiellus scandens TaxID=2682957 RepID=A0ABR1J9U3_9AGAR